MPSLVDVSDAGSLIMGFLAPQEAGALRSMARLATAWFDSAVELGLVAVAASEDTNAWHRRYDCTADLPISTGLSWWFFPVTYQGFHLVQAEFLHWSLDLITKSTLLMQDWGKVITHVEFDTYEVGEPKPPPFSYSDSDDDTDDDADEEEEKEEEEVEEKDDEVDEEAEEEVEDPKKAEEPSLKRLKILSKRVFIASATCVTRIAMSFLEQSVHLLEMDLRALQHVTSIGRGFLRDCSALETIDLSCFTKLVTIDWFFLSGTAIKDVDLSPLTAVQSIGGWFLSKNPRLQHLVMSLPALKRIDWYTGSECSALETVLFTNMHELTDVGGQFMKDCRSLREVVFADLSALRFFYNDFLSACPSLTKLTMSGLPSLRNISSWFLADATSLEALDLSSPFPALQIIENYFLDGCTSLKEVRLDGLTALCCIGEGCFRGCTALEAVDLNPLSSLVEVGKEFGLKCPSLRITQKPPQIEVAISDN